MSEYYPPKFGETKFHCPFCGVFAQQAFFDALPNGGPGFMTGVYGSLCSHCRTWAVWYREALVAPDSSTAPLPHADLPDDVRQDYIEARSILSRSPRGAAALLRLCVQKLVAFLGATGDLNAAIGSLVRDKGLDPGIQKMLDVVRVVGNNAVHPGELDLRDNTDVALALFGLVNEIADAMIARPRRLEEMYSSLPATALEGIARRDARSDS